MISSPVRSVACTCFALRKLSRTVTRLYDQHLAHAGLKTTQFSLLRWAAHEALPVAELAARMAVERTTLTRNLKLLTEAGWIELRPGADARQKLVIATDTGRDKIREAKKFWQAAQKEVQDTLGAETVAALHLQLDHALLELTPLLEHEGGMN